MNQILSVEKINQPKKKKQRQGPSGNVKDVVKAVRFFAIALIIFGIFNIGTGSYALVKNKQVVESTPIKPIINVVMPDDTDSEIKLQVQSEISINQVYYSWNDETEQVIKGNGRTTLEETLTLPSGTNILHVRAINANGQTEIYEQEFTREAKISIQIENAEPNIRVKLEGQQEIAYMTYRWNNEEEQRIDINSITSVQEIRAIPGDNTLTITAVDVNNETETIEKEVQGVETTQESPTGSEPKVSVTTDGSSNFVITASDEVGLVRVECILNGAGGKGKDLDNLKEYTDMLPFEISSGHNTIEVTVYNANGQSSTFKAFVDLP